MAILSITLSIASFRKRPSPVPPVYEGGGRSRQLVVRAMPQARGMRLIVDPRDGAVRLTLPKRASLHHALAWAEDKRPWVEAELRKLPPPQPIVAGSTITFAGELLLIDWRPDASRIVRREADRIVVGGPRESVPTRVSRWLKREAHAVLERETREIAQLAGVTIGKVAIGDPRGRWGSCSSSGDIRYSWRLILAPPDVRRATVAHEVAHRLHMDHSPAFHAAAARLFGQDPASQRRWLRSHGPALHWIGRDG